MKTSILSPLPRPRSRVLRWAARITSLATIGVIAAFMIGEGFDPGTLKARDWMLCIFFPMGLLFGLFLGWRYERWGGIFVVGSLLGFYLVHLVLSGRFPGGWAFVVLAVPGLLLLLSAKINEAAVPSEPTKLK